MYHYYSKSLLDVKGFVRTSPIPLLHFLPHNYSTRTSEKQCFRMNYLINNCVFSPEAASELSKHVSFLNPKKPEAVLHLLRSLNISDSQIRDIVKKVPVLLSRDPVNTISPKLGFFISKGASASQLAEIVTTYPWSLLRSLENHVIPSYDMIKSFLHSDEKTIMCIKRNTRILGDYWFTQKVQLLRDYGVLDPGIAKLLRHWPSVLVSFSIDKLITVMDDVKELGFHPSKSTFIDAMRTKLVLSKFSWKRKVESYERWGWSYETVLKAFIKRPFCMLTSESKIESVMEFLVNRTGWDSLVLAEYPVLLCFSLNKRVLPRAYVLQFLQSRGLIKNVSCHLFIISEKMFYRKYVKYFKDEAPQLLKLYEGKSDISR